MSTVSSLTCIFLFQLQPEQLDCGAAHLQHPLSILQPIKARPVFTSAGLTSVAVSSVNNYTVVFLGTANGRLLKVKFAGSQGVNKAPVGLMVSQLMKG